jgi:hypothetical protein
MGPMIRCKYAFVLEYLPNRIYRYSSSVDSVRWLGFGMSAGPIHHGRGFVCQLG